METDADVNDAADVFEARQVAADGTLGDAEEQVTVNGLADIGNSRLILPFFAVHDDLLYVGGSVNSVYTLAAKTLNGTDYLAGVKVFHADVPVFVHGRSLFFRGFYDSGQPVVDDAQAGAVLDVTVDTRVTDITELSRRIVERGDVIFTGRGIPPAGVPRTDPFFFVRVRRRSLVVTERVTFNTNAIASMNPGGFVSRFLLQTDEIVQTRNLTAGDEQRFSVGQVVDTELFFRNEDLGELHLPAAADLTEVPDYGRDLVIEEAIDMRDARILWLERSPPGAYREGDIWLLYIDQPSSTKFGTFEVERWVQWLRMPPDRIPITATVVGRTE